MNASEALSAGLKAIPNKISSFASTQAAWRFYKNEAVTLSKLQEPLTAAPHAGIKQHSAANMPYASMIGRNYVIGIVISPIFIQGHIPTILATSYKPA